jgi:anaerobic selenocysteine-containing dehydrogenase
MANYDEFLENLNREAYHEGEATWKEDGYTVTRSNHWSPPGCHDSCGLLLYVKDGKLEKVEGDPLSPFVNGKLCVRCLNLPESCNSPERVKYPMIRDGERGENKWKRISWDEALDIIEDKVRYFQKKYGNESINLAHGTGRNIGWAVELFAYIGLQTPMVCTQFFTGFSCYLPRVLSGQATAGDYFIADASMTHEHRYSDASWTPPGTIIVWGNEPLRSNADGYIGHWLVECVQLGSKLISIDPRLTWWGAHADYFLQLRPGTDSAIAIAMLNVVITEGLYDHEFVENWCYGFDELTEHVKDMTPEWAAEISEVPAEDIRSAARLFASTAPSAVQWGLSFEQQSNCMGLNLAVISLLGICGCMDVPGGNVIVRDAYDIPHHLSESFLEPELLKRRVIFPKEGFPWGDTFDQVRLFENDDPHAQKMLWLQSTNPLACPALDSPRAYDILKEIEFVVSADPYITPTAAACADLLLPVAMSPERNSIRAWWSPLRISKKAYQYYEAKSDEELVVYVGKRLNPDAFPWKDDVELMNWRLAKGDSDAGHNKGENLTGDFELSDSMYNVTGVKWEGDFDDLAARGGYSYDEWNTHYKKYEKGMLRSDGKPGFKTPSGRFELFSLTYQAWNMQPLPYFLEPYQSPVATPDLYKKYPLILLTGGRSFEFFHSEHRQLPTMRELHPWPLLQINPKTAEKYGISDGQWVWVENDLGRFRQVAKITPVVKPNVIHAEHGWWFPEKDGAEPSLFGTFDSNPNNVIPADVTGPYGIAAPVKNMLVKIYPYQEGDLLPGEQVCLKGGYPIQKARREAYQAKWSRDPLKSYAK